jgi:hypothetical protein
MNQTTWLVDLKQDPDDPKAVFFELPIEIIREWGLEIGDELNMETTDIGDIVLTKK